MPLNTRGRNDRAAVGAEGHEARVSDAELAGKAVDKVQAGGHHDVDAREQHDLHIVAVDNIRAAQDHDQCIERDRAEQRAEFSQEQRRGLGGCSFHGIRPP